MKQLTDAFGRVHDYLRLSVTDRCNLSCSYCNPHRTSNALVSHESLLNTTELEHIVRLFVSQMGIRKIRLTGGEPLTRKDLPELFAVFSDLKKNFPLEICLTTNGILLQQKFDMLRELGLDRINISLDSLNPTVFKQVTGAPVLPQVLQSITHCLENGMTELKINTVIMQSINDGELCDFVRYFSGLPVNLRFIEYMPFSHNGWEQSLFMPMSTMIERLKAEYTVLPLEECKGAIAKNYMISETGLRVSFISSISDNFCSACNRLRLTADGHLKLCLFSGMSEELDLKEMLNNGNDIESAIRNHLNAKNLKHADIDELLAIEKNNMLRIGG